MPAAATLRIAAATARSKPRTPSDRERLVFQWVKFEGHKQSWVADQLGIHQTTVSRMVERYEKWIAHGRPLAGGLSHEERLRAQRWLTFERNEWILTSALRIAGEMEGFTDVTKSTVHHAADKPGEPAEVRTEHAVIDRSGVAARFLRLAFRVNMEQLRLMEDDPLPPLDELSLEEWEELLDDDVLPSDVAATAATANAADAAEQQSGAEDAPPTSAAEVRSREAIEESHVPIPDAVNQLEEAAMPEIAGDSDGMRGMHKVDPQNASEISTNDCAAASCGNHPAFAEICSDAYAVVANPPESYVGQQAGALAVTAMSPSSESPVASSQ